MSISLLIQYDSFRYFNGGDIELTTEGKIASRDLVRNVDVCKANHHGSHTSSSRDFMDDLIPSVIIISNGNNGKFKHPRQHTLNLYASLDPQPTVFQTNKYLKGGVGGNVSDRYIADLESTDTDGTILIEVNQNQNNFLVSYRDTSITFSIKERGSNDITVVVESLLPNPIGSDNELEEVTLRNSGNIIISLSGCVLRDESGRIWSLEHIGDINPGQSVTIQRNGMPMSLNNSGDEIVLLGSINQVLDKFRYANSQEGIRIITNH